MLGLRVQVVEGSEREVRQFNHQIQIAYSVLHDLIPLFPEAERLLCLKGAILNMSVNLLQSYLDWLNNEIFIAPQYKEALFECLSLVLGLAKDSGVVESYDTDCISIFITLLRMRKLLPSLEERLELSDDESERFRMGYVLFYGSVYVNNSSLIHGKLSYDLYRAVISRESDPELDEFYFASKVHHRTYDEAERFLPALETGSDSTTFSVAERFLTALETGSDSTTFSAAEWLLTALETGSDSTTVSAAERFLTALETGSDFTTFSAIEGESDSDEAYLSAEDDLEEVIDGVGGLSLNNHDEEAVPNNSERIAALTKQLEKSQRQRESKTQQIEILRDKLEEAQDQVRKLKRAITIKNQPHREKLRRLKDERDVIVEEKHALAEELETKDQELLALAEALEAMGQEKNALEEELDAMIQEKLALEAKLERQETVHTQEIILLHTKLEGNQAGHQSEIDSIKERLKKNLLSAEAKIRELQDMIKTTQAQNNEKSRELARLRKQNHSLRKQATELEVERRVLHKNNGELTAIVTRLSEEKQRCLSDIAGLSAQVVQLQTFVTGQQEVLATQQFQTKTNFDAAVEGLNAQRIKTKKLHHQELKYNVNNERAHFTIPGEVIEIMALLEALGANAYIYGGFIRDQLFAQPYNDIDIICDLHPSAIELFVNLIDERFDLTVVKSKHIDGLYRIFLDDGVFIEICFKPIDMLEHAQSADMNVNSFLLSSKGYLFDPLNEFNNVIAGVFRLLGGTEKLIQDPVRILRALKVWLKTDSLPSNEDRVSIVESMHHVYQLPIRVFMQHMFHLLKVRPEALLSFLVQFEAHESILMDLFFRNGISALPEPLMERFFNEFIDLILDHQRYQTFFPCFLSLCHKFKLLVSEDSSISSNTNADYVRSFFAPWRDDPNYESVCKMNQVTKATTSPPLTPRFDQFGATTSQALATRAGTSSSSELPRTKPP